MIPLKVEVAEAGTVRQVLHGETLTWTDITPWLLFSAGVEFGRGLTAEETATKPRQASFTCQTLPDGSVAPLAVRRPVRISCLVSESWQVLWTGSVSGWRQGWAAGVRGVQQVVCTDNIAVAERATMQSIPVATVMDTSPAWCVPLDDDVADVPRDLVGTANNPQFFARLAGVAEDAQLTAGGFSPGSSASAAESAVAWFEGGAATGGWCMSAESVAKLMPDLSDSATLSMFVFLPSSAGRAQVLCSVAVTGWPVSALDVGSDPWTWGNTRNLDIGVADSGVAFARFGGTTFAGSSVLALGVWHHIAVSNDPDAGFQIVVDGIPEYSGGSLSLPGLGTWRIRLGGSLDSTDMFTGGMSCVSAHTPALDQYRVRAIAETRNGLVGESTGARFYRLAQLAGIAAPLADSATLSTEPLGNSDGWTTFWSSAGVWDSNEADAADGEIASLTLSDAIAMPSGTSLLDAQFTLTAAARVEVYILTGTEDAQAQYFADGGGVQEYAGWFAAGENTLRALFHIANPAHSFVRMSLRFIGPAVATVTGGGIYHFAGLASMGQQATRGASAAAALQQCADAERAQWGCTAAGTLHLASRADRHNRLGEAAESTWAQVEDAGVTWAELPDVTGGWIAHDMYLPASVIDRAVTVETRDAHIVNQVKVTRPGGGQHTAANDESIATYGRYEDDLTLCLASEAQASTRAAFEVQAGADPAGDIAALTVDVVAMGATVDVAAVLAAEPGHVVRVQSMPADAPAPDSWFFVEGATDRVGPTSWERTLATTATPATTRAMRVGDLIDNDIPIGV